MQADAPRFLGTGWRFPPRFVLLKSEGGECESGQAAMVSGDEDIRESLYILMLTLRGERILRQDYGFGVQEHVFDQTDESTLGHFRSMIEDAILFFEPRIKVEEIEVDATDWAEGELTIRIDYFVPSTNSRSNVVFPFYQEEGTSILPR